MSPKELQEFISVVEALDMKWYAEYIIKHTEDFRSRFENFSEVYKQRIQAIEEHLCPRTVSLSDINNLFKSAEWKVEAFVQSIASGISDEFLAMAWIAISTEADILELEVQYKKMEKYEIRISIQIPYSEQLLTFVNQNNDIFDGAILRHLSSVKAGGLPVYSGYHAFRAPRDS